MLVLLTVAMPCHVMLLLGQLQLTSFKDLVTNLFFPDWVTVSKEQEVHEPKLSMLYVFCTVSLLCLFLCVLYIYIYIEREREREKERAAESSEACCTLSSCYC